jgi:Methyltransferase domain
VAGCCDPGVYGSVFDARQAERNLREYRKSGLDDRAGDLVAFMASRGLTDKTVLEVGGGIGDLQVELLKAGAASSVNVELSPEYEATASRLIEEEGFADRVERRLGDFVDQSDDVPSADVVVLNRVVCCYPFMARLMDAAIGHTSEMLAVSVPRDRWLGQMFVALANFTNRLRGKEFRAYIHRVSAIREHAQAGGLEIVHDSRDLIWQGMVFERRTG